jgi:exopolyphosphatase/guanosine-5'-triphosphate,3'-diphosphate pyrophosphatase
MELRLEMKWPEVNALLEKYEEEPQHVGQVAKLAEQLFVVWQSWHQRSERELQWLRAAAWLHDIGWSQTPDGRGHHKHSARLISEFAWASLPREEVAIVAQIARYHRKALPEASHEDFQALAPLYQQIVREMGGLLRVADGLDRTHRQVVQSLRGEVRTATLWVELRSAEACGPEREMAKRKGDLLELVSQRTLLVDLAP